MKTTIKLTVFFLSMLSMGIIQAQNPLVTNIYTADPSARVFGDRLYVFSSHDVNTCNSNQGSNGFCMPNYHAFSTTDGTNWTDHGVMLDQNDVPWVARNSYGMWAPDIIEKNGTYYLYFPAPPADGSGFRRIGVATSKSPTGPFVPEKNYMSGVNGIDPGVFTDTNGQSYIYWGGGETLKGAKLSANMKSITGPVVNLRGLPSGYKEGSYMIKRNGVYYFTFPHAKSGSEELAYATGNNPLGPFTYKGRFMDRWTNGCWTNHHSMVEYKGKWILFYHHNKISNNDKLRSIEADFLTFGPNNTINKVISTRKGISGGFGPVTQEPFGGVARSIPGTIEAEDYDIGGQGVAYNDTDPVNNGPNVFRENEGVDIEARDGGNNVGWTANGEWLEYTVNANAGAYDLEARIATISTGKSIVAKLDGVTLGRFNLPNTGGWGAFQTVKIENVRIAGGTNKILRLEFEGGGTNINWLKFSSRTTDGGNCDVPYTSNGVTIERQTVNWTSGILDVSCASSVDISLRASGIGAMENADFLNIYYKINGGPQVTILEHVNTFPEEILTVDNLKGNTLEILVKSYTSFAAEVYTVDAITVKSQGSGLQQTLAPELILTNKPGSDQNQALVYPNPLSRDNFILDLQGFNNDINVNIFDIKGREVYHTTTTKSSIDLNKEDIFPSKGLFILKIRSANKSQQLKLLIN